jgi:ferric-dicitrate binding protein FerR (iron transport regulator)
MLSAWVDRQLVPEDRAQLEAHLRECASCRTAEERARELHSELLRAFETSRAQAARIGEQARAEVQRLASLEQARAKSRRPDWISVGLAMALGFLMAVLFFPPWKSRQSGPGLRKSPGDGMAKSPTGPPQISPAPTAARLVLASASEGIEYHDRSGDAWQPVADVLHFQCPSEGCVRTHDNVRCELVTAEGGVVRMNGLTEVAFHSAGRVELKRGQIWCRAAPQAPLEILPSAASTAVEQARPSPAQCAWSCTAADAACLLCVAESGEQVQVTATAGNVSVKARDESVQLAPSETATITRDRIARDGAGDRLLASSWMQPLLVRKGHSDRELAERVGDLLAQLDGSSQSELYEADLRSLGEYGMLPLLRYVATTGSDSDGPRRFAAMRIICDLAPPWAIGELVGLLDHSDADVRFLSALALKRLTNQTQGIVTETWRGDRAAWEPAIAAWQAWWNAHAHRYRVPVGRDGT